MMAIHKTCGELACPARWNLLCDVKIQVISGFTFWFLLLNVQANPPVLNSFRT